MTDFPNLLNAAGDGTGRKPATVFRASVPYPALIDTPPKQEIKFPNLLDAFGNGVSRPKSQRTPPL